MLTIVKRKVHTPGGGRLDLKGYWTTAATQLAVRATVAATVSLAVAEALQLEHPIYALLAAIIATDLNPLQSRRLGVLRLVATIIGAACGAVASPALPQTAWAIGLGILVAMLISQLVQVRGGAKMAGYICAIVMLHFGPEAWTYAFHRLVETALGVIVAWAISYVPKMFLGETAEGGVHQPPSTSELQFAIALPNGLRLLQLADLQLTLRVAVAATLSIATAGILKLPYPVFACIAAVIATDLAPAVSRQIGLSRIVATVIGAACAVCLGFLPPNVWLIGAGTLASMLTCQFINASEGAKLAAVVCCIVILMHGGDVLGFAFHRVVETGLGVAAAWAISYTPRLISATGSEDG